jgi:hypothetical protein
MSEHVGEKMRLKTLMLFVLFASASCTERVSIQVTFDAASTDAEADASADTSGPSCGRFDGSCNAVSGAGCPNGQACYWGSTSPRCEAIGTSAIETACGQDSDCRPGHTCLELLNFCTKLCCSDGDCSGGSAARQERCFPMGGGSGLGSCWPAACDPILEQNNGCSAQQSYCAIARTLAGEQVPRCVPQALVPSEDGAPCSNSGNARATCRVGHLCAGGQCRRGCDPSNPNRVACASGQRCSPIDVPLNSVGVCVDRL